MRVRKPTSKRTTTRMREGIKKKAAAQRRKDSKIAKKSVQWKSRKPKDLGIPSNFPYKEELLGEIENKKLLEEELRKKRKEEQKLLSQRIVNNDEKMEVDDNNEEEDYLKQSSLAALVESAQQAAKEFNGESNEEIINDEEKNDFEFVDLDIEELIKDEDLVNDDEGFFIKEDNEESEKSLKAFNKFFKAVVDISDVILYVLDARDPEGSRSKKFEETILKNKDKKLILLLNKIDLIPNDIMKKWINYYKNQFLILPIKSSSSNAIAVNHNFNKNLNQSITSTSLLNCLKKYANKSDLKRSIVVGIVGFPNVGKSSIINSLTNKYSNNNNNNKVCPTGNQPGITTNLREIKIDNKLKIVDSPGIVFPPNIKNNNNKANLRKLKLQQEAKLTLLNALPIKLLKDPTLAIQLLLKRIKKNEETFELFNRYYDLPILPDYDIEEFTKQVLIQVARNRGRLSKGGIPNLHSAAMMILNDWKDGRFVGWVEPPEKPLELKMSENTIKSNGKIDQVNIVQEWSKEFDLDGLFESVGIDLNNNE